MKLTQITRSRLIDIKDYYQQKQRLVDESYFNLILDAIKKDSAFEDRLEYQTPGSKKHLPVYTESGIINFNLPLLLESVRTTARIWQQNLPNQGNVEVFSLVGLLIMLHESSHVWQQLGLDPYPEINRLNHDVYYQEVSSLFTKLKISWSLKKLDVYKYYERQANIDAMRELVSIYAGDENQNNIKVQHIFNLGFRPKGESIVHDTLNASGLKYNYNTSNIPKDLLFEVGLPTPPNYQDVIYKAINRFNYGESSYEEVMRLMKKL